MTLQEICQAEYFGLNPNRAYHWMEALERKSRLLCDVVMLPLNFFPPFAGYGWYNDIITDYKKEATELSNVRDWEKINLFSISELKEKKGSKELINYLVETAGNVKIKGFPSTSHFVAPERGMMRFITGGIFPRLVKIPFNFTFYMQDSDKQRAYLGITPEFYDAWPHVLAASDNKEKVHIGVQLHRDYDFFIDSYVVKYLEFPNEKIVCGEPCRVVPKNKIKELVESKRKQKAKDRVFRAMVDQSYIF